MRAAANVLIAPPQPGDLICVPTPGPVGKLIEIGQWAAGQSFKPYEHAMVYIGNPPSLRPRMHGWTASAYTNGVGLRPLSHAPEQLQGSLWTSGILPLSDVQRAEVVAWCLAHPAVGYSAADYFALAAARLKLNHILPPLRDYIADSGHMICSQYSTLARLAAGDNLFDRAWDGLVMPMDIAHLTLDRLAAMK